MQASIRGVVRAAALAVGLGVAGPAIAAGVAQSNSAGYGDYVQQLAQEVTALSGAAAGNSALGTRLIDLGSADGLAGLSAPNQALIRAMNRTYDVFRALGGSTDRRAVVEREDGRVYVGLDGEGGRWFADAAAAAAFLLSELVETSSEVPAPVQAAVADAVAGDGCGVSCVAEVAFKELIKLIAVVPRGTTVTLTLSSDDGGFSEASGKPVVEVPSGFVVHEVTYVDAATLTVKVSVPGDVATGRSIVSAFNAADAFRAVDNFAVQVVDTVEQLDGEQSAPLLPGSGTLEALGDDHAGDTAGASQLAGSAEGRLEAADDTDTFRIDVEQAGTLTVSTSGGTDVRLTLSDGQGNVLAEDDDANGWYNATLSHGVVVGTYFVTVSHCCAGTGSYSVAATLN